MHLYWLPQHLGGHMEIRQTDTAAIARNFAENSLNILKPQIDWGGTGPGYVETDFQIFPFLVSLLYRLFGIHEWIGRAISLMFSCLTAWFVYRYGLLIGSRRYALTAVAVFFILPLETFYGTAFMSEPLMLLGLMAGLYHFVIWMDGQRGRGSLKHWWISLALITIAGLIKPTSLVVGLPMAALANDRFGRRFVLKPSLLLFALVVCGFVTAYYLQAQRIFHTYGNTFWLHGYGIWIDWNLAMSFDFWYRMAAKILSSRSLTYGGFALFAAGLFMSGNKFYRIILFWIGGIAFSFFVVAKGNILHDHYQIPLTLAGSFITARAIEWIFYEANRERFMRIAGWMAIILLAVQVTAKQAAFVTEAATAKDRIAFAEALNRELPKDCLVATLDDDSPLILYYSHRKGWIEKPTLEQLSTANSKGQPIYIAGQPEVVTALTGSIPVIAEQVELQDTRWGLVKRLAFEPSSRNIQP